MGGGDASMGDGSRRRMPMRFGEDHQPSYRHKNKAREQSSRALRAFSSPNTLSSPHVPKQTQCKAGLTRCAGRDAGSDMLLAGQRVVPCPRQTGRILIPELMAASFP
ncbi:MAG: hypothetical protein RIS70_3597 [Planctomycetota bacterium]